jgi:hypothetical protein
MPLQEWNCEVCLYWALSIPLFITARRPSRCHYRSGTVRSLSTGHCPFPFSSQQDVLQDAAISSSLLSPPPLPWLGFLKLLCIHVCKMTLTATWMIFQGCWHGVQEWNCVVCLLLGTVQSPSITARRPSRCHYRSGTVWSVSTGTVTFPFASQQDILQDASISSSLPSPTPLPWLGFLKLICIHVCKMTLTATWMIFQGCWHGVQEWNCVVCLYQALSIPLFITAKMSFKMPLQERNCVAGLYQALSIPLCITAKMSFKMPLQERNCVAGLYWGLIHSLMHQSKTSFKMPRLTFWPKLV